MFIPQACAGLTTNSSRFRPQFILFELGSAELAGALYARLKDVSLPSCTAQTDGLGEGRGGEERGVEGRTLLLARSRLITIS